MSVREIKPGFAYINVIIEQDGAGTVYLFFQREAGDSSKYLAIHTQNADGTPSKTPLLENRDMYEPRGVMLHPDGTAMVYGSNRDRSKVLKIDVPGWKPSPLLGVVHTLQTRVSELQAAVRALAEGQK